MIPVTGKHDTSAKTLLGYQIPANHSAERDLDSALDNVFHHPNIAAFVATRLIRALVTSNPSRGYITRVAGAFNGTSGSTRGDTRAVTGPFFSIPTRATTIRRPGSVDSARHAAHGRAVPRLEPEPGPIRSSKRRSSR